MTHGERRTLTLERTYRTTPEEIWELWTTAAGIESFWGPDGFEVKVRRFDLRPGGEFDYTMSATGPDQIEFLKQAGMKLISEHRVAFTELTPHRRLAYMEMANFIPGVEAYEVHTVVEFESAPGGVRMIITFDAMHDDRWTQLATMGREGQLDHLAKLLEG
jgi:uncharacterized protein YndB with AHSA1/START domain